MNSKLQSFISAVGVWVWLFAPYASAEYLELNDGVILGETIITDQSSLSDDSLAVWQKYSDALFSDNNLERSVALEALSAKAESGDPDLQQLLGNYFAEFLNGRRGLVNIEDAEVSAPSDYKSALYWLTRSFEGGNRDSANNIASLYYAGSNSIEPNYEKAREWYEIALAQATTTQHEILPSFNLGIIHEVGLGVPSDWKVAAQYYEVAARSGYRKALWQLGQLHEQGGNGLPKSVNKAVEVFSKAAAGGHEPAVKHLIANYPNDSALAVDVLYQRGQIARAIQLSTYFYNQGIRQPGEFYVTQQLLAADSDPITRELLAEHFLFGDIIDKDYEVALKIASMGETATIDNLCQTIFISGVLLSTWNLSSDQYDQIFEEGSAASNGYCLLTLGLLPYREDDWSDISEFLTAQSEMLLSAVNTDENYARQTAYAQLFDLAESGDSPQAALVLGREFLSGELLRQDFETAIQLLEIAANAELSEALELLEIAKNAAR